MTVSFNQIPVNLLAPGQYVEFDNSKANKGLTVMPNRILVIAQKLASGTAAADVPFMATRLADVRAACGRGSHAALMYEASQGVTDMVETTIIPLADNGAGAAATGAIAVTGAPTEAGLLNLYVAGVLVQAAVAVTDTPTIIATALTAAINANADLPVTAASAAGTVTLTARNKGTLGNDIDLRLNYYPQSQKTPAGLNVAITAMASGAGDPSIAAAIANLGETQYNTILIGLSDSATLQLIETELASRWGPLKQNDGRAHTAVRGTVGTLNTWSNSRNSEHVVAWSVEQGGSPMPVWKHAAVWGTICAYYLGGIDPARPVQTLVGPGLLPATQEKRFTRAERNNLLSYGLATFIADAGGNLMVERAVTTYVHNSGGFVDPSYRDAETMYTLSYLRYSVRARIAQKFARYKLANDGANFAPGQAIVTPRTIRGELIALFRDWEEAGLVENFDQFKTDLIVERSQTDANRIDVLLPPDLINQFRVFAAKLEFRL
ncbi:phage tail sheath C-terminal domain-containing protein [Pseudoduganella violaceinigra]|uniref:phage tail sheath C-terminal domain-containing protein n=1 Tax=Pseudoduganella violaceinigra TaxID=246602 RepID=UPI0004164EB5|nr:phage tail sheath C-terminal domain-containing protein [Pseudoduganella violaceinigra]